MTWCEKNKAIVDVRIRPGPVLPLVIHSEYTSDVNIQVTWVTLSLHPTWSACDIKPIKGQYDIVHETRQHTAMLPEKNNATAIGNMHRKFGEVWISSGDTYAKLIDTFHFSQRHLY